MEENFIYQVPMYGQLQEFLSMDKLYPNDMEFGYNCRMLLPTIEVNKNHPNDEVLGKYVRKYLTRFK